MRILLLELALFFIWISKLGNVNRFCFYIRHSRGGNREDNLFNAFVWKIGYPYDFIISGPYVYSGRLELGSSFTKIKYSVHGKVDN